MAIINSFPNNADEFIGAEEVMRWLHGRTSGVYGAGGNAAVTAVPNSMAVSVAAGIGWLNDADGNGIVWWSSAAQQLTIDPADSIRGRIDRIIVEWYVGNYSDKPEIKVLKGTTSSTPSAPALTNTSLYRQISIARVSIPAGTTEITDLLITDERLDPSVCGIVTETVTADTSMINAQYQAAVTELENAIAQAWGGVISDGAITWAKFATALKNQLNYKVLYLTNIACSAMTGDFATVNDSKINANHVVTECVFANPSAITTDFTWTTASGSLKLNGTCASATTVNIVLVEKGN